MTERKGSVVRREGDLGNEGVLLLDLMDDDTARPKLRSALEQSGGVAAVIVHPFFADAYEESKQDQYPAYITQLQSAIQRYRNLGLPLILFETDEAMLSISTSLQRMGIEDGTVFVVRTEPDAPIPTQGNFESFIQELSDLGLQKATVVGSYLRSQSRQGEVIPSDRPRVVQQRDLRECVGFLVQAFNGVIYRNIPSPIWTIPGAAVFPRRPKLLPQILQQS